MGTTGTRGGQRTRGRINGGTVAAAVATLLVAACVPAGRDRAGSPAPGIDPAPRLILGRDIDRPAGPDCTSWRYGLPDLDTLPAEYRNDDYRYTSERNPNRAGSSHHICGQRGPAVDLAWTRTRGRSDVVIAVLDSGIKWHSTADMYDLVDQAYLNAGELPLAAGSSTHDTNADGAVTMADFTDDPRVSDRNGNEILDPEDLIMDPVFSNGVDDDHDGYVDDISGWDFLFGDNDPFDNVDYGHGTGEARDSVAAADNTGSGPVGTCPGCRFLPVRVSDSFIAEGGRFAAGVLFALDSGADVVQEALGALNNPIQAQQAIDAAYQAGVPVVASMADEASKHPNLPAALDHTIPVNSLTNVYDFLGDLGKPPVADDDYLALNGCTNYGGITWVSVPSSSCSSEATGLGAGILGLIESAARDADLEAHPSVAPATPGRNRLSANEVAQLLRGTADDVDFATPGPADPPNDRRGDNFERYPTTPGWDATSGFGRVNAYEAVRAVLADEVPPEADLTAPSWFEVLPVTGTVSVTGAVAAVRSSSYSYRVEWTTGLQPPPHPGADVWHLAGGADALTTPVSGTLAHLDLAAVAAALPDGGRGASVDGSGTPDEDRFAVRVRVVVTDAEGRHGVNQRHIVVHDDPQIVSTLTRRLDGAGASSPVFVDVDGADGDELVVATDAGDVHVLRSDGTEVTGWPRRSAPATWWPDGSPAAAAAGIEPVANAIGVGGPVVVDLDGDGSREIAVADAGGDVSVWHADGTLAWRRHQNPLYSTQEAGDEHNRMKEGFLAQVAAGDLDGDGDLELVAAGMDRHLYAWHSDGTPVAGFPVLVVDPRTVEAVDPLTHAVEFGAASRPGLGGELIVTPAIGDLDGDGRAEIVVGAQEQYDEPVAVFPAIGVESVSGNTRVYAVRGDGNAHPRTGPDPFPAHPDDQAYLPGWPVPIAMLKSGVLPTVGNGVNTQAAIGDVTGSGHPQVVVTSSAGPVYVLNPDGRSPYQPEWGQQVALSWLGQPFGSSSDVTDGGFFASAFGGPALGNVTSGPGDIDPSPGPEVAVAVAGAGRALDQLLPGHQPGDTAMMVWNGRTAYGVDGFPRRTRDLAFFVTPAIVDVDGDGRAEVVAGHGVSLIDAFSASGGEVAGWPKVTGGWVVGTPGFGDLRGDGRIEMAVTRRDGWLQVWSVGSSVDGLDQWPRFGHDNRNSANLAVPTRD